MPDDVVDLGKLDHGLGFDQPPGAGRNVVDEERELGGFRDRLEVGQDAVLGGPVVIGADLQAGGGSRVFRVFRPLNRFLGAVGTGPGHHRHTAPGFLDHDLDHLVVLFVGQGGRLPGCPAGHQAVAFLLLDEVIDELPEPRLVEGIVVFERRDQGNVTPGPSFRLHNSSSFFILLNHREHRDGQKIYSFRNKEN